MRSKWIMVQGRRVKLFSIHPLGKQSVNICTVANKPGQYEEKFYFRSGRHVDIPQGQYGTLAALREAMRARSYRQLP